MLKMFHINEKNKYLFLCEPEFEVFLFLYSNIQNLCLMQYVTSETMYFLFIMVNWHPQVASIDLLSHFPHSHIYTNPLHVNTQSLLM